MKLESENFEHLHSNSRVDLKPDRFIMEMIYYSNQKVVWEYVWVDEWYFN